MDLVARLASEIEKRRTTKPRYLVGIDGPDAAGKTTLARRIAECLTPTIVQASIDDFHRPRAERHARGADSGDISYRDTFADDVFRTDLLDPFRGGAREVRTASLDYEADLAIAPIVDVPTRALLLVDGVFLQRPELCDYWDLVVYLDISPELSARRGIPRDVDQGREYDDLVTAYEQRYLPGQAVYRDECNPKQRADVLIDNTDPGSPRIIRWPTVPK